MIIHKDSHIDHAITPDQWAYILEQFKDRSAFFIETVELPEGLGHVMNGLYGPSCGDAPVPESEVYYARRGDRAWTSRMTRMPARPTRFVRVIAGPHDGHVCVLFTAYGVASKDMPAAPKEPEDLVAQMQALALTELTPMHDEEAEKLRNQLRESQRFWADHALATEAL